MTDTSGVSCRVENAVAWLTVDRPEVHNALDHVARTELVRLLGAASADLAVRCVVLTAAGEKAFCTGADLRRPPPGPSRPDGAPARAAGDVARGIATGWQQLIASVLDCEKPVIAAVNGTAAGAGAHLALACDLVLAADTARFIEVFSRRGIAPDAGGAYLLTRLVGPQRAKELIFFGEDLAAPEAERIGLVNRVVPAADLAVLAAEWAARLAGGPTVALAAAKRLVNRALDVDRGTAFAEEAWAQEAVMTSADAQEGVRAFVERRTPDFRGW